MASDVVGIDLGTTNSLAARYVDGRPKVVRDADGTALVPSVLSFHPDGTVLVGTAARRRALADPTHTIFSVKRLMGKTLADLAAELPMIPHQIVERETAGERKVLHVRMENAGKTSEYTPEELSAMILREVRRRAGNPTKAVITVPAYFDDSQRQATRDAGRIAGLDVLRIINEPTAAALAYGLDRREGGTVVVYDLGGGTFDCSILSLSLGVFKVLSTNGDTYLGGDDFDRAIMNLLASENNLTLDSQDATLLQTLREHAENAKIALTNATETRIQIAIPERGLTIDRTLTRSEFEALVTPLIDRTMAKCRSAMRDAQVTPAQVDEVVLVGGATRMPIVRERVKAYFGKPPHTELNPDEVVAIGAAVQAEILTGGRKETLLLDVVPLSLGIETYGGVVDKVIHRNTTIPARATTRYTTYAENQTAVLLNIYQGERELTNDCRFLGKFKLGGIPPMPAQMAQVDVTFLVDANGLLTVAAKELRSGQQASVTVQPGHGLSEAEVEELVLQSVEHAKEDFTNRRLIELRNKGEADLRHGEKAVADSGSELSIEQRELIAKRMAELREALNQTEVDRLQTAINAFGSATLPLAELMMNRVVKGALGGKSEANLDAEKL